MLHTSLSPCYPINARRICKNLPWGAALSIPSEVLSSLPWLLDYALGMYKLQGLKFDVSSCSLARTAHANYVLRAHPLTHMEKSWSI